MVGCALNTPVVPVTLPPPQTATGQAASINTAPSAKTTTPANQLSGTQTTSDGTSEPLNFVRMIDATQGWGIANRSILRTENGGTSWSNVTPAEVETVASTIPAEGLSSFELKGAFLDAQTAWIAAPGLDNITLFHTADGGRTWQTSDLVVSTVGQVYPIEITSFTFLNAQTGWLLRSTGMAAGQGFVELYQTQTGGASWRLVAEASPNASGGQTGSITTGGQKTGASFRDTANGWLTGYSAANAIYVYRTRDGGTTWSFQPLSVPGGYTAEGGSAQSYPPAFFDDKKGLMPIYLGKTRPGITLFFYMTTGGDSWSPTTPISSSTNDFVWNWADSSHGFVAEEGTGILYSTSDGGKSWSKITVSGLKFSQLDFISPVIGWGISDGSLVQTLDGGKDWHTIYP